MKLRWRMLFALVCISVFFAGVARVSSDEPTVALSDPMPGDATKIPGTKSNANADGSVDAARQRAKVMHDVYAATLDVLHDRYFHRDRAIIPARVMQDIFDEIERQSKTEARWISASMSPMGIDHEPKTDFEKQAAREIAAGTEELELVEDGYYRRAGAIALRAGCVSCHGGFLKDTTKPKFAGLIISVPLRSSSAESNKSAENH